MKLHLNSEYSMPPRVSLCRTFHPVGQGAFYTEVFSDEKDHKFIMVYDCGSVTSSKVIEAAGGKTLYEQIKDFAKAGGDNCRIDYLFISHFHNDHINGIKELIKRMPPKQIFLPMLPMELILASRIANLAKYGSDAVETDELIQDLYFGQHQNIIGVSPTVDGAEIGELYPSVSSRRVQSGDPQTVGIEPYWRYRPFNSFDCIDERVSILLEEVKRIPDVLVNDILDLEKALEHLDELKGAYRTAMKNINENLYTLVVESEPVGEVAEIDKNILAHCVYFGDFEPHEEVWKRFLSTVDDYGQVGTIQVPHHGSKSNWRKDFLTNNSKLSVISSGSSNRYHHPNYWVIDEINHAGVEVKVVSERPTTIVQTVLQVR